MNDHILLATDGHEPSEAAIALLERLGDRSTSIDVLCVETFDLALEAAEDIGHYSVEAARERAKRLAEAAAERLRRAGFSASTRVEAGSPADRIVDVLADGGHQLAVLGGGRHTWLGQRLLGSVSTGVLHSAATPVLIVREARDGEVVRVLVGADGSEDLERALTVFASVADPERCSLLVLSVTDPGAGDDDPDREAAGFTGAAAEALRARGFECEERVVSGNVARALLEEADEGGHDLVVMGSRGRVVTRRATLGAVSDRLVRTAPATLLGR